MLGTWPASSARAQLDDRKYEGLFEIDAEAKDGHAPEDCEKAVYAELDKIAKDGAPEDELQAAKNRFLTTTYRQLDEQLLHDVPLRHRRRARRLAARRTRSPRRSQTVSSTDLQRVVKKYFTEENRAVAVYTRKGGGSSPRIRSLASLPAESKAHGEAGADAYRGVQRPGAAPADADAHGVQMGSPGAGEHEAWPRLREVARSRRGSPSWTRAQEMNRRLPMTPTSFRAPALARSARAARR